MKSSVKIALTAATLFAAISVAEPVDSAITIPKQPWSPELVKFLVPSILGFALATLFVASVLLWKTQATAHQILRVLGFVLILGLSSLLLIIGHDSNQLTPVISLFSAMAGYLMGKDTDSNDNR